MPGAAAPDGAGPEGAGPEGNSIAPALRSLAEDPADSALFLDFDGTLSGVVPDPRDVCNWLPGVPALLTRLAGRFALVAVVSGRPTSFLADALGPAVGAAGVQLVGLYGLERALGGPEHTRWARTIDAVVEEATARAPRGVYVEPKGLTVALHWRNAPEHRDWVLGFAERQHAARGLLVSSGRAERELRPPLSVDKGTVLRLLVTEHDGRVGGDVLRHVAAFGDDMGDLPAFAVLADLRAPDGRPLDGVRVAAVDHESPPEVAAAADVSVPGAAGAVALLRELAVRAGTGGAAQD